MDAEKAGLNVTAAYVPPAPVALLAVSPDRLALVDWVCWPTVPLTRILTAKVSGTDQVEVEVGSFPEAWRTPSAMLQFVAPPVSSLSEFV